MTAWAVMAMPAMADAPAESFVASGLERVIGQLSDPATSSSDTAKQTFDDNLSDLVDIRRIGRFVIGRYGRTMPPEDLNRYLDSFEDYLEAIYYQRIRQYHSASFRILGSVDIKQGDSIVKTEIRPAKGEKPIRIDWRVQRNKNTDGHKVLDMALRVGGNQIWLAQEQRSQFMVILEKGNGNIDTLIGKMQEISQREERLRNN